MKNIISILILLAGAALCSLGLSDCTRNEIRVSFDLPEKTNRTYTLLYYASDPAKGWITEEVVNVAKGHGEAVLPAVNPTLIWLFQAGAKDPQAVIYAERGDRIEINGRSSSPSEWTVSGNTVSESLSEWRTSNAGIIASSRSGRRDDRLALNKAVGTSVAAHPSDPVSALLMLVYFDRRADEAGFRRNWNLLRDDAADRKWKDLVSRSDMDGDVPAEDRLPARIVLKTLGTGCDTIEPGRVPMLLYFTRNNARTHGSDIAVLRSLVREYPDSSRRVIAEVGFDTDSMTRLYPTRTDSLRTAVRAWMPLGVSDATAREAGVTRMPYMIFADSKGRVVYRGDNMEEAAERFRESMK